MFFSWLMVSVLICGFAVLTSQVKTTEQPSQKPGTCPAPVTNQECPHDTRDLCISDHECQGVSVKCCNLGCHNICIDPNDLITPTTDKNGCPGGKFRCNTSGICINRLWRCDGTPDCDDNSDEEKCGRSISTRAPPNPTSKSIQLTGSKNCSENFFMCHTSHVCINKVWRCDGTPDCDDGSDEQNCETTASSAVPTETSQQTTTRVQRETMAEHTSTEEQSTLKMPRVNTIGGQTAQTTAPSFASTEPFQQTSTRVHRKTTNEQITTKPGTTKTTLRVGVEDSTTEGQPILSMTGREAYQTSVKPQTSESREHESSTSQSKTSQLSRMSPSSTPQSSSSGENTVITGQLTTQQATTTDGVHAFPGTTDKPGNRYDTKRGKCPKITRVSCPRFTEAKCIIDDECPSTRKCCSNGCFLECLEPENRVTSTRRQRYKPGYCKSIQDSDIGCPQTNLCTYDTQCPGSQKCCYHACRKKICYGPMTKEEEQEMFRSLHKRGDCPYIQKPAVCVLKPRKCNYDIDCGNDNDEKCCFNGCNNVCVRAANLPRPTSPPPVAIGYGQGEILPGLCPPYIAKQQCSSLVQDQCTCDSNCENSLKCCFDGCKRVCLPAVENPCDVQADLVFLMDTSTSIGQRDYNKEKQFVKDVAKIFRIRDGGSRAAAILYNSQPSTVIKFSHHSSYEGFARAVDKMPYLQGQTRIDRGLREANNLFLLDARSNAAKILLVLTDGKQTTDPDAVNLRTASQPLRDQGVQILAIGVGHNINMKEIHDMVDTRSHAFTPESFSELLKLSKTIAKRACKSAERICYQRTDLGFIIDTSDSISSQDFEQQKAFVKAVAQGFRISAEGTRAGVMSYSSRPFINIVFGQYDNNIKFNDAVDQIRHLRGDTRPGRALRYAANSLFYYPRSGVPAVAIFISNNKQNSSEDLGSLSTAVQPLHQRGVRLVAIGVGAFVDKKDIAAVVKRSKDAIFANSYGALLAQAQKVTMLACSIPRPTSAPTEVIVPDTLCSERLGVVFIMDSSRSIDITEYNKEKMFVKELARKFQVGSGSRAAVIIYSDDPSLVIKFDDYSNLQQFQALVDRVPFIMQRTRIDKALTMASDVMRASFPGFTKLAIVMTDGRQTRDPDAINLRVASRGLFDQGATVLAVGVGPEINEYELQRIVHGDTSKIFTVASFDTLSQMVNQVSARVCNGGVRTEPVGLP